MYERRNKMGIAEERAERSKALHERRKALVAKVKELKGEGMSNHDIATMLGIKEATVLICEKQA